MAEPSNLGRLRIKEETTFGVDETTAGTSFTNFLDLPIMRGTFAGGRAQAQLDPTSNKAFKDQKDKFILGPKSCTPSWQMQLHSHGVSLDGNNSPVDSSTWAQGLLLRSILGGEFTVTEPGATTEVQGGSTATSVVLTTGHGSQFTPGIAFGVVINGRLECREIAQVNSDTITPKVAFSTAPTTGTTVYAANTYYLRDSNDFSLQLAYEGKETSHRFGYLGCNGNLAFGMNRGELLTMSPSLNGASWLKYGTATLANFSAPNFSPIAIKDSEFIVGEVGAGASARNRVCAYSRDWTLNLAWAARECTDGVETVDGWERLHQPPVLSGTLGVYRDNAGYDFEAAADARTSLHFSQQFGGGTSGAILFTAPEVQVWIPTDADASGLQGLNVAWSAATDTTLGASSDLRRAALRMHIFGPTS